MSQADKTASRVGTLVVDSGELLKRVQEMCPHHKSPSPCSLPGYGSICPLRRQICIRRKVEDIHVDEWEPWESLSNRGLRKKGVSARLSMTILAAAQQCMHRPGRQFPLLPNACLQRTIKRTPMSLMPKDTALTAANRRRAWHQHIR